MNFFNKTFLTLSFFLITLSSYSQRWVPLSSEQPKPVDVELIQSSEEVVKVHLQVAGFYTFDVNTPRGKASIISVPKAVNTLKVGDPNIPMFAIPAIIGDDARMNVRVESADYTDFEGIEIAPSKGDFPRSIDPATVPYTYSEAYKRDAFFPEINVGLYEPYILRDFRGQNIIVYPFAYNPVTNILRVYHDMTITMYKEGQGGANVKESRRNNVVKIDPDFKNIYQKHFINYNQTLTRYTPVDEEGDMLIICHDAFMDAMTGFVNWKQTRGIKTTIVPMSSVGSEANDIQGFVLDQYNANPDLAYVLLVGDDAQVPGTYFRAETTYSDWSGKGDNIYGQVAGGDLYNDIFVGRFSANTVAQVATQVERSIYYERDIDATATWLENGEGMAAYSAESGHYSETDYGHMENIRLDLLTYNYTTVYQDYSDVYGYTCSVASINEHINNGVGILNYINHGNEQVWSVASYSNENINTLTNDNKLPFIWSVACKVGKYDNTYTDHGSGFTVGQEDDCLAEAWMHATNPVTNAPTGAIGGMFSYISQPWQPPMYGQDEMVDILIESYESNIKHTLGGTSINGIMAIIDQYGASDINAYATHQGWVLYGDPSLMLHTKAPEVMNVTHSGNIVPTETTYSVYVENGEGAAATITRNNEILGTAKVVNGVAEITITSPGADYPELTLCVFGFNKVTYLDAITVNTGNQYAISATVSPSVGGNVTGAGAYYANQNCTLTATPNLGYVFANWTQGNNVVGTDNTYSFTVNGNANITANFTALANHIVNCTESSQGSIIVDKATAYQGETVTIAAQPADGYSFSAWNVTDASNNTITVTDNHFVMPDSDVTITATYIAGYTISLADVMYGSISANKTSATQGNTVTLSATPANGYQLDAWKVYQTDNVSNTIAVSGNSFTMPAYNVTVSAIFGLQPGGENTIGSGTSMLYYLPTFESYKYSLTEQIYTAAEVGGAGTITTIAFQAAASKTITRALDIYMKNTEKAEFSNSTDWENVSTLYRVFSGNVSFNGSGWTTINLTTPFEYDGVSNLLICVDDHTATGLDSYDKFYTYSTGSNRAIIAFRDGTAAYNPATANIYAGTRYTVNNQMKFMKSVSGCEESLALSTEQMFGFRYEEGEGPSEIQHFSVTGANLIGNVTITAPSHFEISQTENGNYASSLTLTPSSGQVSQMVYVRLNAALSAGRYTDEYLMLSSGNISREISLSGEVTGTSPVILVQTISMSEGWNWWSTYLDVTLEQLEEALGANGIKIVNEAGEYVSNNSIYGWGGNLNSLESGKMYKIQTNSECEIELTGVAIDPSEAIITLNPGINWIGFISAEPKSVNDALANLNSALGDVVSNDDGLYATYSAYGWGGTLTTFEPGEGYVYNSKPATGTSDYSHSFTSVSDDIFAYQNGNDIVVNGVGILQVYDVMGRLVTVKEIHGVETMYTSSIQSGV